MDEFRYEDQDPIQLSELAALDLATMPEDVRVHVLDDYFPDATIAREGEKLVCRIEDHMYTKYWEHRYSAYAFAEAMERAIIRLSHEGHPFANPERDDDDVHIFVRWDLILSIDTSAAEVGESIRAANDLVSRRADSILDNSDSVLVLGKDTGPSLNLLKQIAARLEKHGYFAYIIKEQPDRTGESVIQKVMRHALMCKFVIVENTEPRATFTRFPTQQRHRSASRSYCNRWARAQPGCSRTPTASTAIGTRLNIRTLKLPWILRSNGLRPSYRNSASFNGAYCRGCDQNRSLFEHGLRK